MSEDKQKKNVPELRFPEFSGEWEEKKVKDEFKVVSGSTPLRSKKEYYDNKGIPWIKTMDLNNSELYTASERVSELAVKELKLKILPKNTILIAMYGGFNQIGRTGLLTFESTINQAISALLDINQQHNSRFFQSYFNHNVKKWRRYAASSRKDPNITKKDIEDFKIIFPTYTEQQKIGTFFNKLDRQIELEEKKLALLEEQKKGYMQKIFSQELRFKDDEGQQFEDWTLKSLSDVFDLVTDYVANGSFEDIRKNVSYSEKEEYAYVVRLQDASSNWKGPFVYTDRNAYEFLSKTKLFFKDIIMSNVGTVGKIFKIPNLDKPMTLGPNSLLLRSSKNDMNFLYFYLNSTGFKRCLLRIITPGVQSKVNKTDLKTINFSLPSENEQRKIGDFLEQTDKLIENQLSKIGLLKSRKKSFLQNMFI